MLILWILQLIITLTSNSFGNHDYHMSLTELRIDGEKNRITIASKVFVDDLEDCLGIVSNSEIRLKMNQSDTIYQDMFERYFESRMQFSSRKKDLETEFLGFEYEQDIMWAYLVVPNVKRLKELTVTQQVFFELFQDQANIVHVYDEEGNRNSLLFTPTDFEQTVEFD